MDSRSGSIPESPTVIENCYMKRLLLILVALTALLSCKRLVYEDRTQCPSFLFFDITNYHAFETWDEVYATVYSHPAGALIDDAAETAKTIQDKDFYFTVRGTGAVKGYGLIGHDGLTHNGSRWTTPLGYDYKPLFRFSYQETVQEESFIVPVEFVKDYCKVNIQFVGTETFASTGGKFPFDILVRGNTTGIDALTGLPIRGPFEYRPEETALGHFEFILPRQADHELSIEFWGREGVYERTGHLNTYDLWDILFEKGGVTWEEKNLPDVDIIIDYVEVSFSVQVTPWDSTELHYDF